MYFLACVYIVSRVQVRISNDGVDFSSAAVDFHYTTCPPGTYCSELQVVDCPIGAFCSQPGQANYSLCPPGTFRAAQHGLRCSPCTPGHYCPTLGLEAPMLCAAGMVCSMHGLQYPNTVCPRGHYCPMGVSVLQPTSYLSASAPQECPENTWCSSGVASNVSIPGNHSTPQPCLPGFVCYRGSDSPQGSGPCPSGYFCPPGTLKPMLALWHSHACAPSATNTWLSAPCDAYLFQAHCRLSALPQITALEWAMCFPRFALLVSTMTK